MNYNAMSAQKDIYLSGFSGRFSTVPFHFSELEAAAQKVLSPGAFAYIAGGAGLERTMQQNVDAFKKYQIIPRMLCNVAERDISIELFGRRLPAPFLLSPIGVLELAHSDADRAVASAAASVGIPYIFSNQASIPMEESAGVMADSPRWFQLYWSKSRDLVASFVSRAESCKCSAIVVTLDTTLLGWRTRDLDVAYLPFLEGRGIAQYTSDPVFQKMMDENEEANEKRQVTLQVISGLFKMVNHYPGTGFLRKLKSGRPMKAVKKFINTYSNPSVTWEDLKFLREQTNLPILLKGILHAGDAQKALDFGMNGVLVSNHGGRQVDGAIATIDALGPIVAKVNGKIPVLLDSGIRSGADVFKALALGATAVCIGRPYVYGLAIAGEVGVQTIIRNYLAEFELTMALAGCKNISEITRGMLAD